MATDTLRHKAFTRGNMGIYINRTLNMKKIKAIGFDMDYTIVRYNTAEFERLTHQSVLKKLVEHKNYPKDIESLKFDFEQVIQGLVIDKKRGNLLKVSRFGKVKQALHGTKTLDYKQMQDTYRNRVIDLQNDNYQSLDTSFSISNGVLFAQLVDIKEMGALLPDFATLADDIKDCLDMAHADGSLKETVRSDVGRFIIQDASIVELLERFKRYGKKLLVITNSDYRYTKLLLDYTINPFLKDHKDWSELFELVVTLARKPAFFTVKGPFLSIDPTTGSMSNSYGKINKGIYQGGWAGKLQDDLALEGDEILYLGDHIYGDVVSIKKTFNWRTALVLEPLAEEVEAVIKTRPIQTKIDALMLDKEKLELEISNVEGGKWEKKDETPRRDQLNRLYAQIEKINTDISDLLEQFRGFYNPHWGEMMRAGQEESRFADQVEKYACIYMAKVSDLLAYSPRTYFRPFKRVLPHEV
jgi:HAD superfamily 5'-nucleotidase-like hydrolase